MLVEFIKGGGYAWPLHILWTSSLCWKLKDKLGPMGNHSCSGNIQPSGMSKDEKDD